MMQDRRASEGSVQASTPANRNGPVPRNEAVNLVGRVGFEPTTNWLKANCSTN